MSYVLGVDLGTTFTAAATLGPSGLEVVSLGTERSSIPSLVFIDASGNTLVGESAARRLLTDPDRVAVAHKRRMGDPAPLTLGTSVLSSQLIGARILDWVIDQTTERRGAAPSALVVTHPANWGGYKREAMQQLVRAASMPGAVLLTEPEAAAIAYAEQGNVAIGDTVAVYDLGGGTFDVAILRRTTAGFEIVGEPDGVDRLGGLDLDDAMFGFVDEQVEGALRGLDPTDPAVVASIAQLREACVDAKIALSSDTEAGILVNIGDLRETVRITRVEFEDFAFPIIEPTLLAVNRALNSAELAPDDLASVLLVGGSSRIPLVGQMLAAEFDRPVAVDADPKLIVAKGAALHAATIEASDPRRIVPVGARALTTGMTDEDLLDASGSPVRRQPSRRWLAAALLLALVVGLALVLAGGGDDDEPTEVVSEPPATAPTTDPPEPGELRQELAPIASDGVQVTRSWSVFEGKTTLTATSTLLNTTDAEVRASYFDVVPRSVAVAGADLDLDPEPANKGEGLPTDDPVISYDLTIAPRAFVTLTWIAEITDAADADTLDSLVEAQAAAEQAALAKLPLIPSTLIVRQPAADSDPDERDGGDDGPPGSDLPPGTTQPPGTTGTTATTQRITRPGAVSSVRVQNPTGNDSTVTVSLSWVAPSNTGGQITGYVVRRTTFRSNFSDENGCDNAVITAVATLVVKETSGPALSTTATAAGATSPACSWIRWEVAATNDAGPGDFVAARGVIPNIVGKQDSFHLVRAIGGKAGGKPATDCGVAPFAGCNTTPTSGEINNGTPVGIALQLQA